MCTRSPNSTACTCPPCKNVMKSSGNGKRQHELAELCQSLTTTNALNPRIDKGSIGVYRVLVGFGLDSTVVPFILGFAMKSELTGKGHACCEKDAAEPRWVYVFGGPPPSYRTLNPRPQTLNTPSSTRKTCGRMATKCTIPSLRLGHEVFSFREPFLQGDVFQGLGHR